MLIGVERLSLYLVWKDFILNHIEKYVLKNKCNFELKFIIRIRNILLKVFNSFGVMISFLFAIFSGNQRPYSTNELRGIWLPNKEKSWINYLSVLLLMLDSSINEIQIDIILGKISDDKSPICHFKIFINYYFLIN